MKVSQFFSQTSKHNVSSLEVARALKQSLNGTLKHVKKRIDYSTFEYYIGFLSMI